MNKNGSFSTFSIKQNFSSSFEGLVGLKCISAQLKHVSAHTRPAASEFLVQAPNTVFFGGCFAAYATPASARHWHSALLNQLTGQLSFSDA